MPRRPSEISQEHHQDERIKGRFDEAVVAVEVLGFVVLCMDSPDHGAPTDCATSKSFEHEVVPVGRSAQPFTGVPLDRPPHGPARWQGFALGWFFSGRDSVLTNA